MAPRTRNKKKTKRITSPMQRGDDFGRPPGSATTIAGPSLAPMPAPNQCRCSPRYHNDDGATNIVHNSDVHQVDHHPPRFEVIESDDKSEDHCKDKDPTPFKRQYLVVFVYVCFTLLFTSYCRIYAITAYLSVWGPRRLTTLIHF